MPAKTKHTATTQASGKSPRRRNPGRTPVRQPGTTAEVAPSAIANSFYTLKLKEIPGIQVYFLDGNTKDDSFYGQPDDYGQMYNDLWKCYCRAKLLLSGEKLKIDLLKAGLSFSVCFQHILTAMKAYIPHGCELNIDRKERAGEYFFTVYKEIEFGHMWHCIPIKPVIMVLKNKPKQLNIFLQFIALFTDKAAIDLWFDNSMEMVTEWLEENIHEMEGSAEPDDPVDNHYENIVNDLHNYKHGTAARYQRLIKSAIRTSPEFILQQLSKMRKTHPIMEIVRSGCKFLKEEPFHLRQFCFYEPDDSYENCGLRVDFQPAVIWDANDTFTGSYEEYLDSNANEGIMPAVAYMEIKAKTKAIDLEQFKKQCLWPMKLANLFGHWNDLLLKL